MVLTLKSHRCIGSLEPAVAFFHPKLSLFGKLFPHEKWAPI
jgi:hypothetical protein